ncbi:MAG: 23S rRNA (uracil(1939)-C(5))-methyltransferase RlmD [Bacteroides sp.]|nr:23S rRNA (uracil(1939)-C(5))-methyltransferase RlmD [Bacteroides sp.]
MKKNDICTLEITSVSNDGSGVGRDNEGKVVFVPMTAVGDACRVKILKVKSSYSYGKLEEILTPSPDRTENDCPVFGRCGGCTLRHISYEAEAGAKEGFVRDAFTKIGGLEPEFLPFVKNDNIIRYRNKAQYPIGKDREGNVICGFYAVNSHRIVSCADCVLQPEIFSEIVGHIRDHIQKNRISVYNEAENKGVMRHICLRRGHYSGEINVTLVARRRIPELQRLSKELMSKFPDIKGVALNINKQDTNVIMGSEEILLSGTGEILDTMCGNAVSVSPRSFYQVNTPMAERLYGIAKEFAEPEGKVIADIYCGIGTIGLSMAKEAKKVIGVEIVESAVENARKNAELNGYGNTEFYCADAGSAAELIKKSGSKPDAVILDPARKGCELNTLGSIAALDAERIVMISCNPATAARDCKALSELGYRCERVAGVDLFSRTGHVECVALLTRR